VIIELWAALVLDRRAMTKPTVPGRLPAQVPFIIGNEAGERFGFYGMRNVLTKFAVGWLLLSLPLGERDAGAKEIFHAFVMGVYFFPLLGGWLADRVLGRYRTIFWLSLLYTGGYALLAACTAFRPGFYLGLFLIALGSGGIKPCVSTFVGDQFDQSNKRLAKVVFDAFYWVINFGSFFASLLIPWVLTGGDEPWRPHLAFGIPGLLMAVATLVFWWGRKDYVLVPPAPADPNSFLAVSRTALRSARAPRSAQLLVGLGGLAVLGSLIAIPRLGAIPGLCLALGLFFGGSGTWLSLECARGAHPDEDVDGVRVVLRLLILFALVTPFWSLFDQKASTWILQGEQMQLPGWSWFKTASQMQALNPALVMLLIPLNNLVFFPLARRLGFEPTALRRMGLGITLSGVAWVGIALLQLRIDALKVDGLRVPVLWQAIPYVILTLSEVLVSATGLEFAYSQAPARMKSAVAAFWSLAVTVGNLWVLLVNLVVKNGALTAAIEARGWGVMAAQMFFFAAFAFSAAALFVFYARRYVVVDRYRSS
jgi:POT family proton-dependent oligopeptide transporter